MTDDIFDQQYIECTVCNELVEEGGLAMHYEEEHQQKRTAKTMKERGE